MAKLLTFIRWLWLELRLGTGPYVQRTVIPRLHQTKEITRMVASPHLTLYRWSGEHNGNPLTVTYAGLGYVAPTLKSLLFDAPPAEQAAGKINVWRPQAGLDSSNSDITIIEASKYLIRQLPPHTGVVLPSRLHFILDTRGQWQQVEARFRRDARRNEVSRAKKYGYQYTVSHSKADLEMFYNTMYLPTMQKRHGKLAANISRAEAYQLLRHGMLFLVKRDGVYVSGGLCLVQDGILRFREMGVLNGNQQLMREGAVGAMNYLRICWAHKEGCRGVNFGECWPFLSGIFQSKRKWGTEVSIPPHEHKQIWISVRRDTPAVSQFLQENPCVIINGQGQLHGLVVTGNPAAITAQQEAKWRKQYATPGLKSLLVCSSSSLAQRPIKLESAIALR